MIYSGSSGLVLPVPNKRSFPKEFKDKSRLAYYASIFNSIEINSSFKKLPMRKTVEKWAANVPAGFQFSFKISSVITHTKELLFNAEDVYHLLERVDGVGEKKGCLLIQFPGKLAVTCSSQLEKLLTLIQERDPGKHWKVAVEFRHSSWYDKEIYQLLSRHNAALVLHDMRSPGPPSHEPTADFVYLRFHGPENGYRGSYPEEFLFRYAKQIKAWNAEGKIVYVYFNNTLGDAANNLITLNGFLN